MSKNKKVLKYETSYTLKRGDEEYDLRVVCLK